MLENHISWVEKKAKMNETVHTNTNTVIVTKTRAHTYPTKNSFRSN